MKKNHSDVPAITDLVEKIRPLIEYTRQLAREAEKLYALEVEAIIKDQNCDPRRIQHCLDGILGFCFDDNMLLLFKKLCRHYYTIDPVATSEYVYFYKDMWDNGD
ncbi:MAG: hypothetical protein JZU72_03195 [Chlorobium phaeobacteroides]|jgi:hypothetical protein|nr:hypothetical protein [Chlorobium phaeobacteroides]